jgi:hypothetical protein
MAAARPATQGDGGKVAHRMADASLERRGNAGVLADLEDARRLFDPTLERKWQQKYKFHSARHMKGNFRVFAQARHDPFNKDPAWGDAVLGTISHACASKGKDPSDLFSGVDLTGDGTLNRPELKKVICNVFPALSDAELTAVFDTIDEDHSGEVNIEEFVHALKHKAMDRKRAKMISDRWRNPIHRMKRVPPQPIEGWSHLEEKPQDEEEHLDKVVGRKQCEIMSRLGTSLVESPRALRQLNSTMIPRYTYFGGGGDISRFHRNEWQKQTLSARSQGSAPNTARLASTTGFRDPGPDVRPGFMCDPEGRNTLLANGWRVATPRGLL